MVNTRKLEEEHLAVVYHQLLEKKAEYEQLLKETNAFGMDSLQTMSEDIRLNFDSYLDNLDTYSMIEMKNREIDQLNIKIQSASESLKKVERLLLNPYFGKIEIDFLDEDTDDKEAFYIGTANFTNSQEETLIYDWRSPFIIMN
jgi:DNA helicase-2/ATP-dependent DNA helicase PcrA